MGDMSTLIRVAARRHGTLTRPEANRVGVSDKQLRRFVAAGDLVRVGSAVFVVDGVGDPRLRSMMAASLAIPGSAVTARSACGLTDLGSVSTDEVDLWVPESATRKKLEGVRLFRNGSIVRHRDLTRVKSIRTVNPAIAVIQVAGVVDDAELEHCIDDYLRLYDEAWLRAELVRFGAQGRPGVASLRRVLNAPHRICGVTDSWMERVLANIVAQSAMPPIELQCEVVIDGYRYRVDLGFPTIRLGLEAHSRRFHFGAVKENADNVRDLHFASAGWQLLYLTWSQLQDPDTFAAQLGGIVRRRIEDLGRAA